MNSLKEATAAAHKRAEQTEIVKLIFEKKIDNQQYASLLANQLIYYSAMEKCNSIFQSNPQLARSSQLLNDLIDLCADSLVISTVSYRYADYLKGLNTQSMWAHVYVHYLGDMMGGQMLKRCVPGAGSRFEFENMPELISNVRFNVSIADAYEAQQAFEWTINIYDDLYRRIREIS